MYIFLKKKYQKDASVQEAFYGYVYNIQIMNVFHSCTVVI